MRADKALSRDEWAKLIFVLTLFLGLLVRVFPALLVRFPLNDGGMFYTMSRDLRANGFLIPSFTTYNYSNIPFAYPPLGFYVTGFLGAIGFPDLQIFLWLPILLSFLAIAAYYLLAETLLDDAPRAALATMTFAMIPESYGGQIMGGGVTRSFGVLFLILSIYAVYQLLHRNGYKFLFLSILFCSLAVLSHPEVVLATASGCALLCLFYVRSWRKALSALLVALGVIVLTLFWWGSVLAQHGLTAFLSVVQSGAYGDYSPFKTIYLDFLAPASLFTLIGSLRFVGVLWSFGKRRFFLLAWMLMPYFVEPRSASGIAYFSSSIFIALGLCEGIPDIVDWIGRKLGKEFFIQDFTQNRWLNLAIFGLMFYWFMGGTFYDFSLAKTSLKPSVPQETLAWIKANTPENSQFLILTGNADGLMSDPIQEWFPALARRRSQTTLQGLEWTLGGRFFPRFDEARSLQRCKNVACVEQWAVETKSEYTYLLISKVDSTQGLRNSLDSNHSYVMIYENSKYEVFKK